MTILLSGATGFLGSYLLKRFVEEGFDVIALKRSTSNTYRIKELLSDIKCYNVDKTEIEEIFSKHYIDMVINTVTDHGRKNKKIYNLIEANLLFSIKLLENAINSKVKTFINADTFLEKDINAYALSKNQFVQWMQLLSNQIHMVNIKIEHMYGPLDDDNKFIHWFINELKKNVEKIDLTSGSQKRDFIYIEDVVNAYMIVIENIQQLSPFEEFELGAGNPVAVRKFLELIYNQVKQNQVLATALNFGAVTYRNKENMCMKADISKLKSLGWSPNVNIKSGIDMLLNVELND